MKRLLRALTAGLVLLAATGCTATPALPVGVDVTLFQTRFDYAERILELKVSNGSGEPVTVTLATFSSPRFAESASWTRHTVIPAGGARDLRVELPAAVCDSESDPTPSVELSLELADGSVRVGVLDPQDPTDRLATILGEDCLAAAAAEHAAISIADTVTWTTGAGTPAEVQFVLVPTGAEGSLTVTGARSTILFALVGEDSRAVAEVQERVVIDAGSAETVIRLEVEPARCDPHAVAEDKRGTIFPLDVKVGGGLGGTIWVAASQSTKSELYAFIEDWCAAQ